jgi:hypothetical protein
MPKQPENGYMNLIKFDTGEFYQNLSTKNAKLQKVVQACINFSP